MKKFLFIIFVTIGIVACKAKKGSLNGNVFWKYNNYVGNKPDANAEITIYSAKDPEVYFSTTTDVRGDYKFENIPEGEYLLIVRSANTTASADESLDNIYSNYNVINRIFNTPQDDSFYNALDEYNRLKRLASNALDLQNPSQALKKYNLYNDSANQEADNIIEYKLPRFIKKITRVYGNASNKVEIQTVTISAESNKTVITDFGITYISLH